MGILTRWAGRGEPEPVDLLPEGHIRVVLKQLPSGTVRGAGPAIPQAASCVSLYLTCPCHGLVHTMVLSMHPVGSGCVLSPALFWSRYLWRMPL